MRVLFTSVHSLGHVHPMVPLAMAFRDQGDELLWAAAPSAVARLARWEIAGRPCGLDADEARPATRAHFAAAGALPPEQRPDFVFARIFGDVLAPSMVEQLLPIVDDWSPDLIVSDAGEFAGPLVATLRDTAHVTH